MSFTPIDTIEDRVEEVAVVGGLGNYILQGVAVQGQRTFSSVMTIGQTTWAFCYDPTGFAWEIDRVTFAAGNQLQRTQMLSSSTGSPISFPGNVCQIAMTIPAGFVLDPGAGSTYVYGTVAFTSGAVANDGTIVVAPIQEVDSHMMGVLFSNGSSGGSMTIEVRNNGTAVTGLGAVVVNSSGSITLDSPGFEIPQNSTVDLVVTDATGTIDNGGFVTPYGTQD